MQIESLTQDRLEELRRLWMGTTDPEERERITNEGKVIKAYLQNPKWGSEEVEGNTFCHTCHYNKARMGHYNCLQCAGTEKVNYQSRSIQGIQQGISEWSTNKTMKRSTTTLEDVYDVFGFE